MQSVTPLVGVWIEIRTVLQMNGIRAVTPLVGVWIEIAAEPEIETVEVVTPLVGVWIEIIIGSPDGGAWKSLPLWECGLKYIYIHNLEFDARSLPLWECGLKYLRFCRWL